MEGSIRRMKIQKEGRNRYSWLLLIPVFLQTALFAQNNRPSPEKIASKDSSVEFNQPINKLRTLASPSLAAKATYFATDREKQGAFAYDPVDKDSPDDSVMTLVTVTGLRLKRTVDNGIINAKWFGATGNGATDDWYSLQKGINYILAHGNPGRTLYLPPGTYKISRPLIVARLNGTSYRQASINLVGPASSRSLGTGSANIVPTFNNTFAIGIQMGKGVQIKNLSLSGQFTFPNTLNNIQVDTLSSTEWQDGVTRDNPLSPYAGIVIDPFSDSTVYPKNTDLYPGLHAYCPGGLGRGGSTGVEVTGCSIRNFIVGIMITPSNQQNGELVDVFDCETSGNKVGYAMGQAQSKECHVER